MHAFNDTVRLLICPQEECPSCSLSNNPHSFHLPMQAGCIVLTNNKFSFDSHLVHSHRTWFQRERERKVAAHYAVNATSIQYTRARHPHEELIKCVIAAEYRHRCPYACFTRYLWQRHERGRRRVTRSSIDVSWAPLSHCVEGRSVKSSLVKVRGTGWLGWVDFCSCIM